MLVRFNDGTWMWKTPNRAVYSDTFKYFIKSVIWCHVVLRWFQSDLDITRQAAIDAYLNTNGLQD